MRAVRLPLRPTLAAALLAVGAAACDGRGEPVARVCTDELSLRLDPHPDSLPPLRVGAAVTPRMALLTCGGREEIRDTFVWTADDAAVVAIDPATGRTVGRAPGRTQVVGLAQRMGVRGRWTVTVVP